MTEAEKLSVLSRYAAGELGTQQAIAALDLHDYADLVIELARNDLNFPKPKETETLRRHAARARSILLPRLRPGG